MVTLLFDISIVIITATALAYLGKFLKQPSIIAYILAGIILGPLGFSIIKNTETISLFSELGIIFLLFIVGLQLDVNKIKGIGTPALIIGIGQVLFTAAIGYIIARSWFAPLPSLYLALALTFSSTVVVVKLLLDKNELLTLHGRIALGVLLVQDMVAIISLVFFSSLGNVTRSVILTNIGKITIFFILTLATARFIIPYILQFVARSTELLFLGALSWAFVVVAAADYLSFSTATGAFIAGVTLASTPYALEISSKIHSLRDFFVTIFFVALGMQITPGPLKLYLTPIIIFSLFVIIGNPLIMLVITTLYGYHKRTAFLTSLYLAQISEFSLVLIALGFSLGHIPAQLVAIIASIATLTIGLSTYLIMYGDSFFTLFKPFLWWAPRKREDFTYDHKALYETILCGYNRSGYAILEKLKKLKQKFIVVDYNPDTIKSLMNQHIPCIYGDVGDIDTLEELHLKKINMLISTVPSVDDNLLLMKTIKKENKRALLIVTADQIDEALKLYENGADYVIIPHFVGGDHFALLVEDFSIKRFEQHKKHHVDELKKRKALGHAQHQNP